MLSKWEAKAIKALNPSAAFSAASIDDITWQGGTAPISKSDIHF